MNANEALTQIAGARAHAMPWQHVAMIVGNVQDAGTWAPRFSSPTQWLDAAAGASGYTPNVLRRMVTLREFLRRSNLLPEGTANGLSAGAIPLGSLELLKRWHDIAPDQAAGALDKVIDGSLKYRELKRLYDAELTNSVNGSAGAVFSGGDAPLYFRRYKFNFVDPDAVAIGRSGLSLKFAIGFEFRRIGRYLAKGQYNKILAELSFASSFFRSYWLVVPRSSELAIKISRDLAKLECFSMGVAEFDEDSKELKVRASPSTEPVPDRTRGTLDSILRQGIPDA